MAKKNPQFVRAKRSVIDRKYMGDEPIVDGMELSNIDMCKALNWYSKIEDYATGVDFLVEYAQIHCPSAVAGIQNVSVGKFKTTYGWIARMLSRGLVLSGEVKGRFNSYIESFMGYEEPPKAKKVIPKDKIHIYLPEFEYAIDMWDKEEFDCYHCLTSNNVPIVYATRIGQYYANLESELQQVLDKSDKQLVEGYSNYTKKEIKDLHAFVFSIISDCNRFAANSKKTRAPRKSKTKSSASILKHFVYLAKDDKLKLTSLAPESILGAKSLYTLNTKTKMFTAFFAKDEEGLTVNRTSIDNYDTKTSKCKRVGRQLGAVVDKLIKQNKNANRKILESVNTEYQSFSSRLNKHTILLKLEK